MTRGQILERYPHLRAIGTRQHSGTLEFLSRSAVLEHAKRLGLATRQTLVAESEEEMVLAAMRHARFSVWASPTGTSPTG